MDFHDRISSTSHLGMAVWCLFAALMLYRLTKPCPRTARISLLAYGLITVLLYVASGLYHGLEHPTDADRRLWLRIDRSAVFLMILGSFLPMFGVVLSGVRQRIALGIVISYAIVGIITQLSFDVPQLPSILGYVGMAAAGLLTWPWWADRLESRALIWLVASIVMYGAGAFFEAIKWPAPNPVGIAHHEMLHFSDIAGTLIHFGFVVQFIVPYPATSHRGVGLATAVPVPIR